MEPGRSDCRDPSSAIFFARYVFLQATVRAGADCVQASRGPLRGAPPTGPCAWALMFQIAQQGELASGYAHGRQAGVVEACDLASRPPDSRAIAPDWRDRADFSSSLSFRKHSPGPDRHAEHSHRVNIPSTNSPAKSFRIVRLWSCLVLRLAYVTLSPIALI